MKKFIFKGILFFIIILALCSTLILFSTKEPGRTFLARLTKSEDFMYNHGMQSLFEDARKQDGTTQLIIGDSISRQMFIDLKEENPQASILSSNAAFMVNGQYLVAHEYLEAHPETTDIFLIMHPLTITRTYDLEWTYRYGVMTYVEGDAIQHLDQSTLDTFKELYGSLLMQKNIVELIENSPILQKLVLSYILFYGEEYVQSSSFEIADQHIRKLYDLCQEKGVTLHFYSAPVTEHYREQMQALLPEFENSWLATQYPDYMNDIYYYPTEWAEDLSHFSGEYAEQEQLNETIREAYEGTELLEKINLN